MGTLRQNEIEGITNPDALRDLLYQVLESELGGVEIYTAAVEAAVDEDLKKEWKKYLAETKKHVTIARDLLVTIGFDPDAEIPARLFVRRVGETLVGNIEKAIAEADPKTAQLVAAEAVCSAELKDHANWELVKELCKRAKGDTGKMLRYAIDEVESQEDEHYYHTQGWARELWLDAMGLPAALPPPEEKRHVETAIGAAKAKNARGPAARRHTD